MFILRIPIADRVTAWHLIFWYAKPTVQDNCERLIELCSSRKFTVQAVEEVARITYNDATNWVILASFPGYVGDGSTWAENEATAMNCQ